MGLILVPGTRENLEKSIEKSVEISFANKYLPKEFIKEILRASGIEGIRCWAMTKSLSKLFNEIRKGDEVLISEKNTGKFTDVYKRQGQYYMDKTEFRETYGSTIIAFVTEALHYMKKGDADQVKLFVQGSADIVGQSTFRGKLDDRYMYTEVQVLPSKEDKESFSPNSTKKEIPESNFNNSHLPDLRGRYLKEMISVYSKKLKPIQLEGAVKDFASEGERNAIIYLFFPESLIEKYEQ